MNEALKAASTHDPLTGLPNRRRMIDRLEVEVEVHHRHHIPFTLLVIDFDQFQQINDRFGHDVGDRVLIGIARALAGCLRRCDVCARWDGEKFLILLPQTLGNAALEISDRLCARIDGLRYPDLPPSVHCSISIGAAEHRLETDFTETLERADIALYEAKRKGRNRVALAE